MKPKYKIGEIVKVYEYYADGDIVKEVYHGLIVDRTIHDLAGMGTHVIYDILPNDEKRPSIERAEEFALESLEI